MVRKPEGVAVTEFLLQKLVKVPKAELDREVEKAKEAGSVRILQQLRKRKAKKRAAKRKK